VEEAQLFGVCEWQPCKQVKANQAKHGVCHSTNKQASRGISNAKHNETAYYIGTKHFSKKKKDKKQKHGISQAKISKNLAE